MCNVNITFPFGVHTFAACWWYPKIFYEPRASVTVSFFSRILRTKVMKSEHSFRVYHRLLFTFSRFRSRRNLFGFIIIRLLTFLIFFVSLKVNFFGRTLFATTSPSPSTRVVLSALLDISHFPCASVCSWIYNLINLPISHMNCRCDTVGAITTFGFISLCVCFSIQRWTYSKSSDKHTY